MKSPSILPVIRNHSIILFQKLNEWSEYELEVNVAMRVRSQWRELEQAQLFDPQSCIDGLALEHFLHQRALHLQYLHCNCEPHEWKIWRLPIGHYHAEGSVREEKLLGHPPPYLPTKKWNKLVHKQYPGSPGKHSG